MSELEQLTSLREALVALHKAVLAAERIDLERIHGRLGDAEFLQIAADPLRFGWLLPLSELIVRIDETLDDPDADDAIAPGLLLEQARTLVAPPDPDSPFGRRYLSLIQRRPEVAVAQGAVALAAR